MHQKKILTGSLSFSAGQETTTARPQEAETTSTSMQPATFTAAEVATFRQRLEEGYDLPDPRYLQWLASVGDSCSHNPQEEKVANSSCQDGTCAHSKARKWIGCDKCPLWYHCICVGVPHKKANSITFTCVHCVTL